MSNNIDVHNHKRRLKLALENIRQTQIKKENKTAMLNFLDYCLAEGLCTPIVEHCARIMKKIGETFSKTFRDANKNDIVVLLSRIESRKLSQWTKHDYRVTIRNFFK